LAAQKEIRSINPGARSSPHDVLFAGGKLYFTAEGFKTTGRYDPATEAIEWMLGIGQNGTHLMVMSKDQNTMFVPNRGSNSVSIIDAVSAGPPKFQTTAIPVQGKMPEGLDLSPDGRELWTATRGDGGVSIIDVASRKVAQDGAARDEGRQPAQVHAGRALCADPRRRSRHARRGRRGCKESRKADQTCAQRLGRWRNDGRAGWIACVSRACERPTRSRSSI
jgi:streptogramin lyase